MEQVNRRVRKAIAVARVSTDEQASRQASIPKQLEIIEGYAKNQNIEIVGTLKLEGFSASKGEHWPKMRELIRRKQTKGDFEMVLLMDFSRFVRNIEDGNRMYAEFKEAEIDVLTAKEGKLEGKMAWLLRSLAMWEGQTFAENLAFHTSSGFTQAVKSGIIPPVVNPIYGVDKLFVGEDGKPHFILRHLYDGRKVKLDPKYSN